MALSKYAAKLILWLDRYKVTSDEIIARVPSKYYRGAFKDAIVELAALEFPAPGSFASSLLADDRVTLTWAAVTNATGYVVQRATDGKFKNNLTTIFSGAGTTYANTGLNPNKDYYYRISASASGDYVDEEPNNHSFVNITTLAALAAPATLVASGITSTQVTLTWDAVVGATGYLVEKSTSATFASGVTTVYTGALLTSNATGLTTATQYYFRVKATAANHNIVNYATTTATTT